jgi:UDP:flavonoid glycosyltransferase YjiC (YdhE family)
MVDEFIWIGLGPMMNNFRRSLKLPPIRIHERGESMLNHLQVPISHMWSPAFVPKCRDWPSHVDVVGEFRNMEANDPLFGCTPHPKLLAFLNAGEKPIYIGFGSMVIEDSTSLVNIIVEAARTTNCRVLLQSGWTKYGEDYSKLSDQIMVIGAMPHDYLFSQVQHSLFVFILVVLS